MYIPTGWSYIRTVSASAFPGTAFTLRSQPGQPAGQPPTYCPRLGRTSNHRRIGSNIAQRAYRGRKVHPSRAIGGGSRCRGIPAEERSELQQPANRPRGSKRAIRSRSTTSSQPLSVPERAIYSNHSRPQKGIPEDGDFVVLHDSVLQNHDGWTGRLAVKSSLTEAHPSAQS